MSCVMSSKWPLFLYTLSAIRMADHFMEYTALSPFPSSHVRGLHWDLLFLTVQILSISSHFPFDLPVFFFYLPSVNAIFLLFFHLFLLSFFCSLYFLLSSNIFSVIFLASLFTLLSSLVYISPYVVFACLIFCSLV